DYDKLLARIRAEQLPEDAYRWYLDLRKYGTFVHAGFGLGVERTVAWICGIPHIREAIAFPRTLYKLWPSKGGMATPQIFGQHEPNTLAQLHDVASRAERAALMADGHTGYVMPPRGVAGYRDKVSVVGVR